MSNASKHTPGPWTVNTSGDRGHEIFASAEARPIGAREVCRINSARSGAKRGMPVRFYPHADDAANARLIAAAPDLLEALNEARLQIEYLNEKYPTTSTGVAALAKIDAALAKARP